MDQLLPHYEEELTLLRRSIAAFAARYPKAAARLGISGDHCDDPHVERMLQSFALLAANIDSRLDDAYPEFSETLVGMMHPQYLRPIPACAIARFDVAGLYDQITEPSTVGRGTILTGKAEDYRFRTVYDVTLAPLSITNACYRPSTSVPANAILPPDTTALISITFAVMHPGFRMSALRGPLRVNVGGAEQVVSAMMDTVLLHTAAAFVEDNGHRWTALHEVPIASVGWQADEKLIEEDNGPQSLRLLIEYFLFSKKFDFFGIDLAALARAAGANERLTLHLAIRDVHTDSQTGQYLKQLSTEHLHLFCTPIVNLFQLTSLQLKRDLETGVYSVPALNTDVADGEVWSIDEVSARTKPGKPTVVQPFASIRHGSADALGGPYWAFVQRAREIPSEERETALALVGLDGEATDVGIDQLMADITYTNGDRPHTMPIGDVDGDLLSEEHATGARIVMLATPTEQKQLPRDGDAVWRLLAQMTPHAIALSSAGLVELKRLLRQFASRSPRLSDAIDALKDLRHRPKKMWWQGDPQPSLVLGLEVTLAVNEHAFGTASLSALIAVLEHYFALYVHQGSFVELVVVSANTGAMIRSCEAREGTIPVL